MDLDVTLLPDILHLKHKAVTSGGKDESLKNPEWNLLKNPSPVGGQGLSEEVV